MSFVYVAIGGAFGAMLRYGASLMVGFPYGTLAVNVVGSFIMGLAFVWLADHPRAALHGPLVMTGVLGGFTTFSAFSLDALRLYEAGRVAAAGGYVIGTVLLGLAALVLAVVVARGAGL